MKPTFFIVFFAFLTFPLFAQMLIPTKISDKWGYRNEEGKMVIAAQYSEVEPFQNGFAAVKEENGAGGIITTDGSYLLKNKNGSFRNYNNLFVEFDKKESKETAIYNSKGKKIWDIPKELNYISVKGYLEEEGFIFLESYLLNSCGVLDINGKIIIPFSSFQIQLSKDKSTLIAEKYGSAKLYTTQGKFIQETDIVWNITDYTTTNGLIHTEKLSNYGFYNPKTGIVVQPKYKWIEYAEYMGDLCAFKDQKDLYGFISKSTGKEVIPAQYAVIGGTWSEGLRWVSKDGTTFSYINEKGETALTEEFSFASHFDNGIAITQNKAGNWQLIDKSGKNIRSFTGFEAVSYAAPDKELIVVGDTNDLMGLMDMKGEWLLRPEYENIFSFSKSLYLLQKDTAYSLFDINNKSIKKLDIDDIYDEAEDLFSIKKDGKYGLMNDKGDIVLPCIYKSIITVKGSDWRQLETFQKEGSSSYYHFFNIKTKFLSDASYYLYSDNVYDNNLMEVGNAKKQKGLYRLDTGKFYPYEIQ